MVRLGENERKCARCDLPTIHALLTPVGPGEGICRGCVADLYNLERARQRQELPA